MNCWKKYQQTLKTKILDIEAVKQRTTQMGIELEVKMLKQEIQSLKGQFLLSKVVF